MTFRPQSQGYQQSQVWVPEEAGENRLALAAVADSLLVLFVGLGVSQRVFPDTDGALAFLAAWVVCVLALSFVNHVVGTLLFRGSVAKLLFGMRVLRWKDGRRPRFWQTLWRWLFGFVLIALQYVLEGESVGQACGLRTVRRRDELRRTP
ncbi:RDD family protein [Nocardia amamiensis]|uniref:RDD family protein n=1 Tax=Nocardia amamiensis TaxID=404578 RepID=A0ABS0CMS2_9NOCA|nr:RDD family protein [Nocardia amamiensis]MBF6297938.1 RDD family protein [Nocardia amamiensis]